MDQRPGPAQRRRLQLRRPPVRPGVRAFQPGTDPVSEWFFDKRSPAVGSRPRNDVFIEALKRHGMTG
jgi:hypothetical protein